LLVSARSKLEIEWLARKTGATATADYRTYIGTAGTAADQVVGINASVITTLACGRTFCVASFLEAGATDVMLATNVLSPQGNLVTNATADRTIDLGVENRISFGVAIGNAGDSYDLLGYSVRLIQI
jgi:hypothetical protein